MAAIQLNFTLRTSANCKTVHLLGSWDNYSGQLPLSKDSKKSGGWLGCFKFNNGTLKQGQRYWYYYIIDGYHVSHDPAKEHTTEPTTGRKLNILDIPSKGKSSSASAAAAQAQADAAKRASRRVSASVPKGRSLSPSKIVAPTPTRPTQTKQIVASQYNQATLDQLSSRFARTSISRGSATSEDDDDDSYFDSDSDLDSDVPSLTSRSSNSSSPSSLSSGSSCCTCERYGITRSGDRVKLDCGGARCAFDDDSSECSSEDERVYDAKTTRRQGVVIRA